MSALSDARNFEIMVQYNGDASALVDADVAPAEYISPREKLMPRNVRVEDNDVELMPPLSEYDIES